MFSVDVVLVSVTVLTLMLMLMVHQPRLPGSLLVRGTEPVEDRTTVEGEDNLGKKKKSLIFLFCPYTSSQYIYRVHKMAEYGDVVDPFHLVNHQQLRYFCCHPIYT